jgi:ABC-type sugar transport system permease subunit
VKNELFKSKSKIPSVLQKRRYFYLQPPAGSAQALPDHGARDDHYHRHYVPLYHGDLLFPDQFQIRFQNLWFIWFQNWISMLKNGNFWNALWVTTEIRRAVHRLEMLIGLESPCCFRSPTGIRKRCAFLCVSADGCAVMPR